MMALLSPPARRFLTAALLLAAVLLGLDLRAQPAAAADGDRTFRVVDVEPDDVLNIRAGPSAGYPVVGVIPPAARGVRLIGPCQGWCPVRYHGASGWVHGRFLEPEPAVARYVERPATPVAPAMPEKPARPAVKPDKSAAAPAAAAPGTPPAAAAAAEPAAPPAPPAATVMTVRPTLPMPPAPAAPPMPTHYRVTGVAANAVLLVRSGPKDEAPVVYVFSPRATCIAYIGACQKPWCQVQYPTEQGPRVGWVDARFLAPSEESCR